MLNVTFVTFMYGLAIPILFPIAVLYFVIMYIFEKLAITYYFIRPPMFDEKLNIAALSKLRWAPLFMMTFGWWVMSN